MKKKGATVQAIEHSKKVCDPQPELIDRMEVRRLVTNAYRKGHEKARKECTDKMIEASRIEKENRGFREKNASPEAVKGE